MTTIKVRRGTATQWANVNPVLAAGEPGWDSTNNVQKVGDGVTAWASLPVVNNGTYAPAFIFTGAGIDPTGATDSTAGLQAALNAWAAVGGDAVLPKGTYTITNTLTYSPTISSRLHAYGATVKVGATFPIGGLPAVAMIFISGSNTTIQGLTLDGNRMANRGLSILDSSSHIRLYDCEVKTIWQQATETDNNTVGIRLEGNCSDIDIERCYVHDIVTGGNGGGVGFARGVLISGNTVTRNVKIRGCTFTDITWTGTSADADGICIQNYPTDNTYILVDSCHFKNIFKRAVKIQCPAVTVSNCTVQNDYLGTSGVNTGPDPQVFAAISVYANDCIIANNNIIGGSWFQGIEIGTTASTVNRVTVTGNRVIGGATATMTGSGGIRAYGDNTCSEFIITGNYVGRFSQGIWLSTAAVGVVIAGNQVNGYSVASTAGVLVGGQGGTAPNRLVIGNNSFEGVTRYGVETTVVPTDMTVVGNLAGRVGFEVISAAAFTTSSKRTYAAANAGAGSVSGALDGGQGTFLPQGGVIARSMRLVTAITYSASMTPDAALGDWQTITVTNGTAFTINAPTHSPTSVQSQRLVIEVLNSSGGAMGAITWNAAFVFGGLSWTNPASTKKRYATFEWNGAAWICTAVAAGDY